VLLDAGGVIVLPHRGLVREALARAGVEIEAAAVPRAHYRAVRLLDRDPNARARPDAYIHALCAALEVPTGRVPDAVRALSKLADRDRSGVVLWSEPAPHAMRTIAALRRAGTQVLIVTNSDGHAAENLREAGICRTGEGGGPGAVVSAVIDSGLVGSAKPDAAIFRAALRRARTGPESAVHVGDMLSADVAGARGAGITPVHLDPDRRCRAADHRHVRSLHGIWRHVEPAQGRA
jgi:putative hydrolase of the HAD superfamily